MNNKIKCTQCGCEDLEEVGFPYEVELDTVAVGLVGESFQYALQNDVYASTYICTKCGHFEFFNPKLAEQVHASVNITATTAKAIGISGTLAADTAPIPPAAP